MIKNFYQKFHNQTPYNRLRFLLIMLMQMAFVGAIVYSVFIRNWLTVFVSLVALVCVWLPSYLSKSLEIRLPLEFEFLLNLFIYASIFLGEIGGFYTRFWWWDIALHVGSGMALGFIGFLILYSYNREGKLDIHPSMIALFAFSFALSLGIIWEIFEFSMDQFFGTNMQKPMFGDYSGLTDTMWDLIVDAVGALIAAVSGYFYLKKGPNKKGLFEKYLNIYFENQDKKRKNKYLS